MKTNNNDYGCVKRFLKSERYQKALKQANEIETSTERVEVCRGRYRITGDCVKYGGECTKEDCDYWQT